MTLPEKKRVLFLDDEEQILDSLRVALRRERKRWSMRFFSNGADALASLAEEPADIIVTDMRMPQMNGAEFLEKVTEKLPNSVRIVLSGEAAEELAVSAIPFAHQWISKPTEAAELVRILGRALATSELTHSSRARQIVTSVAKLPVLPQVYRELTAALAADEVCLDLVCGLVQKQPSVSARVLQMSNSAFFGLPRAMGNIREAVGYLGLETIKNLVFAAEVICELGPEDGSFPMSDFLMQATATSKLAAELLASDSEASETAASAGLLHDIGRLVLLQSGEHVSEYLRDCKGKPEDAWIEAEERLFGATHAEVGGALLGVWGLPHNLVEAVAYHHNLDALECPSMEPAVAVHVARAIVSHELDRSREDFDESSAPRISPGALALIDAPTIEHLATLARESFAADAEDEDACASSSRAK